MSEWVPESDWSKVAVGDRVRLTCYAGSVEGEVALVGQMPFSADWRIILSGIGIEWKEDLWFLFVVPKPTAALPTKPGIYADNEGAPWVLENGRWYTSGSEYKPDSSAPFTRLESQADTARKVLKRVRHLTTSTFQTVGEDIAQVAAEFGVIL